MRISLLISVILGLFAGAAQANTQSFSQWVNDFKAEASGMGISDALLDQTFATMRPVPRIIELDRKQPEGTVTLDKYLSNTITNDRIIKGKSLFQQNRAVLEEIGRRYGVQPQYIVALWGIETSYGANTGGFSVPTALATLAYDGRRSEFFRKELIEALQIIQAGHISLAAMQGSWAGAMGQSQFMPSSFLKFAVDYNGDGRRDIWTTQADVFASIANYLASHGWDASMGWGQEVQLPTMFNRAGAGLENKQTLAQWQGLNVRTLGGGSLLPLGAPDTPAAIVFPGNGTRAFLVFANFDRLLKWNKSSFFGTAVGTLADSIAK